MPSFRLTPNPPFRLDLTSWVLRRRPTNTWDSWDGEAYRRVLMIERVPVEVTVVQRGDELEVTLRSIRMSSQVKQQVTAALTRLLGLYDDLSGFYRLATSDERLGLLAQRFYGFKPPRFPNVFEALVNGITCQQLSLTVGVILLNRLVEHYGSELHGRHAFPEPGNLIALSPEQLVMLGYSRNKARALIELSAAISEGRFEPACLEIADDQDAITYLEGFRGIGRWTAEYALLRGLGRTNVFPGDDVGARNNLQRWLHLPSPMTYDSVRQVLHKWAPYGGLIYFHLLLDGQEQMGYLNQPADRAVPPMP